MRTRSRAKRHIGLKVNTWRTIYLTMVVVLSLLLLIITVRNTTEDKVQAQMTTENQKIVEIVKPQPYKEPSLAPLDQQEKAERIIRLAWGKDYKTGMAIAGCESGFRETIVNSIGATGYFQIYNHEWSIAEMQDGVANAMYAYKMWQTQGFTPWVSSKSCWEERI